ncbi:MAG TPA: glycosyltransferase [Galbitalea sp.]
MPTEADVRQVVPVRVAHVIHDLRPGGTERRMLAVLAGLEGSRFQPLLVCIDGLGALEDDARALGLEPVVLGRATRVDLRGVPRLAALLRRERVEIVHGWLSLANVFARTAGTLARVPVRIAAEGGAVTTRDPRRARRDAVLERTLAPLTDAYIANSSAVAASLREKGVPTWKIEVIPNGVEIREALSDEERVRLRAALGGSPGVQLIGMVARLDAGFKDHQTFLAALAALVAEGRPVHGAIVGDGDALGGLVSRAEELGLADRVTFTGYIPNAPRAIAALDVSVLLTSSEGFSNVLLESMAAGVPILATAIPANCEAIESEAQGLLVPVGSVEETATALRRLLDDPASADQFGQAARRRAAERYSMERQAASTVQLYERLLAQSRR